MKTPSWILIASKAKQSMDNPTIDASMNDPIFAGYMRQFMNTEVNPILEEVEGIDTDEI